LAGGRIKAMAENKKEFSKEEAQELARRLGERL
jgi:hypothetical protein